MTLFASEHSDDVLISANMLAVAAPPLEHSRSAPPKAELARI